MDPPNPVMSEMESLKARLRATWMAGDFGRVAKHLEPGAEAFIARLALKPGTRLLDVAAAAATWRYRRRARAQS
jgi:hypothetical protein